MLDFAAEPAGAAARSTELTAAGLVVTEWEPCVPGRTDLPRRMADPARLLVGEDADGSYAGSATVVLRRYPRPSQGSCSGEPTTGLLLVLISPRDDDEHAAQALRDWGDFVHLRHIAETATPGYRTITPYENADGPGSRPRYCHFYEMHTDDPEASFRQMTPLVEQHLGDSAAFRAWARHPQLDIDYVQTFRRVGT